ncbi:MAG: sterol desaturase family protein [Pyrinomonadaceae bacterium]|nr:sterol desaturase family protein [Pyrinomonadaceae bacterium]
MNPKVWKQLTPFYFYILLTLVLGGAALMSETRSLISILLLCFTGALTWGLIEYGLHRLVFHFEAKSEKGREFVYGMHLSHHADPKNMDDLFASLRLSLPLALGYCLLTWLVTGSWQAMVYLFIGLTAGYFYYEFMHYQAHHRSPRLRLFRYLKKYHLLHHHQTSALHFGVTSPVFDYLFGTFQSTDQNQTVR